ncbi:hypothetical protein [Terriglobus sp. RCC_193]|uniref:phage major capsid protein n=1 Tax=Terriglobus sp. RCC_193 TaxID=3239218 RepID=UPI0035244CCC
MITLAANATRMIALTAEADLSLDEQQCRLSEALTEQFGKGAYGEPQFYLIETFPTYIIARGPEEKLFKIGYTMSDDNTVTYADAQEVERAYVPVATAAEFDFTAAEAAAETDAFPIVIMKAGWGKGALNGKAVDHYYPPEFVKELALAAEAHTVPFGRRHPDQRGPDPTGANDPERIAGFVQGGLFHGNEARGSVQLFGAEADLRSKLHEARQAGKADVFAVSALHLSSYKSGVVEGRKCQIADKLIKLYSVDLVGRGGAGGRFLAAQAAYGDDVTTAQESAVKHQQPGISPKRTSTGNPGAPEKVAVGAKMKDFLLRLLNQLKEKDASTAAALTTKLQLAAEADYDALGIEIGNALASTGTTAITAEAQAVLDDIHRERSRNRIETKLSISKLPEPAKTLARSHLEARLTAEADLADTTIDTEISTTREAFAAMMQSPVRHSARIGLETIDKVRLAAECLLDVKSAKGQGVTPFKGIRDAYVTITGDSELKFQGGMFALSAEAIASDTFPLIMQDAMHKKLLEQYAEETSTDKLNQLVTFGSASDFRNQYRERLGGLSELPVVNENDAYVEMAYPTDEGVSYAVSTRGGVLTISRRTIINDDSSVVQRFPGMQARAARNTLRTFLTQRFVTNPNYGGDAVAMFHANHANLYSGALSTANLKIAQTSLRRKTEPNSGAPLDMDLNWIMVPPELEGTAIEINNTQAAGNGFYQRFGANNERIIVNARLADVDDWFYGASAASFPFIEVGFLNGQQEPELFTSNDPTQGKAFSNDQAQFKVRFEFGGTFTDYRGIGKFGN